MSIIIRAYEPEDEAQAKILFDKFYAKASFGNLNFPDLTKYLSAFTVKDGDGIITVGGVKIIAEACLITDKDRPVRDRVIALREALNFCGFVCREFKFDCLHAVTDDPTWANQMKEYGFVSRGEDLEIHVGDIK